MGERLVMDETPMAFFKEQLAKAMEHQKVSTSAFTEYYLVNLLAGCVQAENLPKPEPPFEEAPLAFLYLQALHASHRERARLLRAMGDTALFISGFFADSLARRLTDLQYYRAMGGRAYARLSQECEGSAFSTDVFHELAGRFLQFADLLAEVSEASHLQTNHSILKLYEKWIETGSPRAARLLVERGLQPMPGSGVRH